jgi:hypothetical protein
MYKFKHTVNSGELVPSDSSVPSTICSSVEQLLTDGDLDGRGLSGILEVQVASTRAAKTASFTNPGNPKVKQAILMLVTLQTWYIFFTLCDKTPNSNCNCRKVFDYSTHSYEVLKLHFVIF